ncbi:MAG: Rieske 2Fe-2S domain-containing protein [Gammaproteobacteria bacterium]|nr:Rieske 2Fe-2S domain-containing protein [Gammaproteobacteria bacterium]
MDPGKLIGASTQLAERGPAIRFEIDEGGVPAPAFVIRYQGRVYAYVNRCAHVSLELDFLPGRFFDTSGEFLICATHGALYEPDTGRCAGGPCNGAGLEPLRVVERGGRIELVDGVVAVTGGRKHRTG